MVPQSHHTCVEFYLQGIVTNLALVSKLLVDIPRCLHLLLQSGDLRVVPSVPGCNCMARYGVVHVPLDAGMGLVLVHYSGFLLISSITVITSGSILALPGPNSTTVTYSIMVVLELNWLVKMVRQMNDAWWLAAPPAQPLWVTVCGESWAFQMLRGQSTQSDVA